MGLPPVLAILRLGLSDNVAFTQNLNKQKNRFNSIWSCEDGSQISGCNVGLSIDMLVTGKVSQCSVVSFKLTSWYTNAEIQWNSAL